MIKETKVCNKCGIEKSISEFRLKKHKGTYVLNYICNDCEKIQAKIYRENNRDKIREINKKNHEKNYDKYKEKILEYQEKYRKEHQNKIKKYKKEYYKKNKDKIMQTNKDYRDKNQDKIKIARRIWFENNKEKKRSNDREYYNKQKDNEEFKIKRKKERKKYQQRKNELEKQKYNNDIVYKFRKLISVAIRGAFIKKGEIKNLHTMEILGCEYDFFIKYLLDTYKNNYGEEYNNNIKVHIDHIIPISTAKTKEDVIKLNHYTNLQLLKAEDNLHKGAKLDWRIDDVK